MKNDHRSSVCDSSTLVSSVHYCSSGFHPESYCWKQLHKPAVCLTYRTLWEDVLTTLLLFLLTPRVRHKHLTCMCYHYITVHTSVIWVIYHSTISKCVVLSTHTYIHLPPYTVYKLTAGSRCILLLSISTLHNYFHSIMVNCAILSAGDGPGITDSYV